MATSPPNQKATAIRGYLEKSQISLVRWRQKHSRAWLALGAPYRCGRFSQRHRLIALILYAKLFAVSLYSFGFLSCLWILNFNMPILDRLCLVGSWQIPPRRPSGPASLRSIAPCLSCNILWVPRKIWVLRGPTSETHCSNWSG